MHDQQRLRLASIVRGQCLWSNPFFCSVYNICSAEQRVGIELIPDHRKNGYRNLAAELTDIRRYKNRRTERF